MQSRSFKAVHVVFAWFRQIEGEIINDRFQHHI